LGTTVVVQNVENGMFTTAVVTDTGGFGKLYGRILDMTPAVANQINLKGKGQVRVWPL
jgi:rare lipoprotein A (peptidoglycan hydrolase)